MPRTLAVLLAILSLGLSSCGEKDTHQKIMTDNLVLLGRVASILEDVENEESAKAAAKELETLIEEFEVIAERSDAIGKPTAEIEDSLNNSYDKQRTQIHQRLTTATEKAKATQGNKTLLETLDRLGKTWNKIH